MRGMHAIQPPQPLPPAPMLLTALAPAVPPGTPSFTSSRYQKLWGSSLAMLLVLLLLP